MEFVGIHDPELHPHRIADFDTRGFSQGRAHGKIARAIFPVLHGQSDRRIIKGALDANPSGWQLPDNLFGKENDSLDEEAFNFRQGDYKLKCFASRWHNVNYFIKDEEYCVLFCGSNDESSVNILICPDKFKGSLTAREACTAIADGVRAVHPNVKINTVPLADGGEGTCSLLTEWHGGKHITIPVKGPLFAEVMARYGISNDGSTAFIEMAEASGLMLLEPGERNPLHTTTLGTGELIADALARGATNIILGIGGSATNDAGMGMAAALGYVFLNTKGEVLSPVGENLVHIHRILIDKVHPALVKSSFTALCDVRNPLYGPDGAAFVYGPQKGADKSAVALLDRGLQNFEKVATRELGRAADFPGAGAAGGLGAGAKVFLHAAVRTGVGFVIESTDLVNRIHEADIVVTGEGKIDSQTLSGKVVSEVARHAREAGKPVVAVCGVCELSDEELRRNGIHETVVLASGNTSPEEAMNHASECIRERIGQRLNNLSQLLN